MAARSKKNELIDKFLREELTADELVTFRELWNSDPDFVKEVQDYSRMTIALKAANRFDENNKKARTGLIAPFRRAFFKYQSVAAIFLLAVMLPLYLLLQGQKRAITAKSPEVKSLAKNHFIKGRLSHDLPANAKKGLLEAILAYEEGQMPKAIALVKLAEKEKNQRYSLILADLYFEMDKPDSAVYYYSIGLTDHPDDSSAYWNSLMSRLVLGDFTKVKKELRKLSKPGSTPYGKKANQLLLDLE